MNFAEYQSIARTTAIYPNVGFNLVYPVLGLNGESGEVAEKVKKLFRDDGGVYSEEFRKAIAEELGDVLWYIAAICSELAICMDDVADANATKLEDRLRRRRLSGSGDDR